MPAAEAVSTTWQPGGSPRAPGAAPWEGEEPWQPPGDVLGGWIHPGHPQKPPGHSPGPSSGCHCPAVGPEHIQNPFLPVPVSDSVQSMLHANTHNKKQKTKKTLHRTISKQAKDMPRRKLIICCPK